MNLVWKCISGGEFDKSTDNTQRQLLLDAYRNYTYDGFSFNNVETYSIPLVDTSSDQITWKDIPDSFTFSSGVGAWSTGITINDDGSFVGEFHDLDIDRVLVCEFTGRFSKPQKINVYTYSMELEELTTKEKPGKTYYEDDIKYICSEPYGFDNAKDFYIYLPNAPISEVEEAFLSWSHLNINNIHALPNNFYGIYNIGGEQGFISYSDN